MDKMDAMNKIEEHEKFERWRNADAASEIEIKNGKMSDKDLELAYGGGKEPQSKKEKKEAKKAENQKKLEEALRAEDKDIEKALEEKSGHKHHKKVDIDKSIKNAQKAVEDASQLLRKGHEHSSGSEVDLDEDDHQHECVGECLRYKLLYEHLKKEHENMHNAISTYDPTLEHPEINDQK